jgi:hypothetical protein
MAQVPSDKGDSAFGMIASRSNSEVIISEEAPSGQVSTTPPFSGIGSRILLQPESSNGQIPELSYSPLLPGEIRVLTFEPQFDLVEPIRLKIGHIPRASHDEKSVIERR